MSYLLAGDTVNGVQIQLLFLLILSKSTVKSTLSCCSNTTIVSINHTHSSFRNSVITCSNTTIVSINPQQNIQQVLQQ